MDILGPNLYQLHDFCKSQFGMKTLCWIGSQMIRRIESLHALKYVHRDIKPENFLIGTGKKANTLFIIDFGLSKRYICPKTCSHIELKV